MRKEDTFATAVAGDWIGDGQGRPHWRITANIGSRITYLHNGAEQTETIGAISAMGFTLVKAGAR